MKNFRKIIIGLLLMATAAYITSCVKGDFDEPPLFIPKVDFEANTTIAELKASYTGLRLIEDDIIISGIVVANDESGNLFKKLIIQDETAGIELALDRTNLYNEFKLGQRVFVKCKGMYIGDYNNLIQLGHLFNNNIGRLPEVFINRHVFRDGLAGPVPEPQIATVNNLNFSMISKLLKFENVRFSEVGQEWAPQTTDATNRTMVSQGGNLVVRTSRFSRFSGDLIPDGYGDVTGVLSIFGSTYQLTLRDTFDLHGFSSDTPPPPPPGDFVFPPAGITPLNALAENFDGIVNDQDIALPGWTVQAVAGSRLWRGRAFQAERYAQATAFNSSDPDMRTWMVTPPVIYQAGMNLSFRSSMAFYVHDGLSVWILYNYDGTNTEDAVWQQIDATLAGATSGDHTWVPSGDINLSQILPAGYSGNIYIGFLYTGSPTNTTTYRIDDVMIGENGGGGGGGGTGSGSQNDPYDIAEAIARQGQGTAWIQGYIVGAVIEGQNSVTSNEHVQLTGPFTRATHVLLADNPGETNYTNMLAAMLPSGTALRTQVNLVNNPENLGKWLKVTGNLSTYFGIAGLRDSPGTTNDFELEDNGGGGGAVTIFSEDFQGIETGSGPNVVPITLSGWTNHAAVGTDVWEGREFSGDKFAQFSSFYSDDSANEVWLITPGINLNQTTNEVLTFQTAQAFFTHNALTVYISDNYTGSASDIGSSTWVQLPATLAGSSQSNYDWVNSGNLDLSGYTGTIYIAFKYIGSKPNNQTSTYRINNILITGDE